MFAAGGSVRDEGRSLTLPPAGGRVQATVCGCGQNPCTCKDFKDGLITKIGEHTNNNRDIFDIFS